MNTARDRIEWRETLLALAAEEIAELRGQLAVERRERAELEKALARANEAVRELRAMVERAHAPGPVPS